MKKSRRGVKLQTISQSKLVEPSAIFADEEDEENEYGNLLKRMKEKFNYLSEKCQAVGSELTNVRQRMTNSWSIPETKAQPEEVLRQEVRMCSFTLNLNYVLCNND